MPDPDAVHQALSSVGSCVQRYNQAAALQKTFSGRPPAAADGGVCFGICLDWLRRVVARRAEAGYDTADSKIRRAVAVQSAYDNTAPAASNARHKVAVAGVKTDMDQEVAVLQKKVRDAYSAGQKKYSDVSFVKENTRDAAQAAELQKELDSIQAMLNKVQAMGNSGSPQVNAIFDKADKRVADLESARRARSPLANMWPDLPEVLAGSGAHANKKFGDLEVALSVPKGRYSSGADVARQLLQGDLFGAGRGALVGFSGSPGHSIALHRSNTSQVVLFDPNVGIYQFASSSCGAALDALVTKGYPELAAGGLEASFTVFGTGAGGPTVSVRAV